MNFLLISTSICNITCTLPVFLQFNIHGSNTASQLVEFVLVHMYDWLVDYDILFLPNTILITTDFIVRFGTMILKALIASCFLVVLPTRKKVDFIYLCNCTVISDKFNCYSRASSTCYLNTCHSFTAHCYPLLFGLDTFQIIWTQDPYLLLL